MTDLHWLSLSGMPAHEERGDLAATAVTEHTLQRIRATAGRYRAFVTVLETTALSAAARCRAPTANRWVRCTVCRLR